MKEKLALLVVLVVLLVVRTITITSVLLVVFVVLLVVIVVGADPPGHLVSGLVALLPGLGVTDRPGDLPLDVLGHLVALPLHVLLADGGGSIASGLSLSLAVSVTVSDHVGVMTNNSGAVVNLLGDRVAVLGDDVLALLDVGGVHNHVVLLVADLSLVLNGLLVALLVGLAEALEVVVRGVSVTGLSLGVSLGVSGGVTSDDELRVVTHDSGAVMDLLVMRLTVLGHGVGALLDVGGVHHHVVLLVADLLDQ